LGDGINVGLDGSFDDMGWKAIQEKEKARDSAEAATIDETYV
jgi:hypothetical protein